MIFLSSLLEKLEFKPDGWNYLHLKDVQDTYSASVPQLDAIIVCISAKVFPATDMKTKFLLTNEISNNKIYEQLLSFATGVVIDNKEMPNGHIWMVFPIKSEMKRLQDCPNPILRFKGIKREGVTSIVNVDDGGILQDLYMINLIQADDKSIKEVLQDEFPETPFNTIVYAIQIQLKENISKKFMEEKKL